MLSFASRAARTMGARAMSTSAASAAAKRPNFAIGASAVAAGVAAGCFGYKTECLKIELDDATAKKLAAALSAGATPTGPRYNTLMPSPAGANIKCCVVEVRAQITSGQTKRAQDCARAGECLADAYPLRPLLLLHRP